ncbi:hypothetical protein LUZ60_005816 [Juncus effusus]|nr:hypothetical protein LUZ60_005816 [Juncus effusus]
MNHAMAITALAPSFANQRSTESLKWRRNRVVVKAMRRSNHLNFSNSRDSNSTFSSSTKGDIVTYSSIVSTNIPLYESRQASFDEYLKDRPRVIRAVFPSHHHSKRLNEEEWRIQMVPIQFLFISADMVVVMRMRCKTQGKEYPSSVPIHASSVLELQATSWELKGLNSASMPSRFSLSVKGTLYPDRKGKQSHLKGHLEMGISLVRPPVLGLVPDSVLEGMAETILRRMADDMNHSMRVGLPRDFSNYQREKLRKIQFDNSNSNQKQIKRDS